ncbi:hypothetical protein BDW22DRAFT_1348940 [Trametopsis cervina]|nr:hypothetical protein BDW22DRAFT_1348940 [Trametopsis cervina]
MEKKESSREYLARRAKDELEEACASEHTTETTGERCARNILNCLDLYLTLQGNDTKDNTTQRALSTIGAVTRRWPQSQWALEVREFVMGKWAFDVLNGMPLKPTEDANEGVPEGSDDETDDVTAHAMGSRQFTAHGKDVQVTAKRNKGQNDNVNDRQTRASRKAKEAIGAGKSSDAKTALGGEGTTTQPTAGPSKPNRAAPAAAYSVEDLVGGMLTDPIAVPFHNVEAAMGGEELPYTQAPLNSDLTLRSVRKLLAEVEHDIAVKQWQAHSIRSLERALMQLNTNTTL